jgi:hypothetical protein
MTAARTFLRLMRESAHARRRAKLADEYSLSYYKPQSNGGRVLPVIAFLIGTHPGAVLVWVVWSILK